MWGWFSKKKKEPKTLDQMSNDELKEFKKKIKRELRDSTRQIDREIFSTDRIIKDAQRKVEKKIKEKADKNVIRMYAKNVVKAQKLKQKHMQTKNRIRQVEFNMKQMIANIKLTKILGK